MRIATALAIAGLAASAGAAEGPKRIKIAVMDLGGFGMEEGQRALLSEVALTSAGGSSKVETIGKSDIAAMLGFEKQKQMMGCGDDFSCIAEVGGALGVEYMITGSVGAIGELHRVDVKLVEVRKARVAARAGETVSGGVEELVAAVQRSVRQVLLPLDPDLAPPEVETRRLTGRKRRALWVGGAGLACLAGGATLGLLARSSYQEMEDASAAQDLDAYDAAESDLRTRSIAADSLLGVGVVAAGVGTWLWFTDGRPAPVAVAPVDGGALVFVNGRLP